jgi:N4-gp56 family major capsid protein
MPGTQTYSGLNPRTQLFAYEQFLERGQPYMCLEKFIDSKPVPSNSSKVISLRRYNSLPTDAKTLVEGVTPAPSDLTFSDYTATLVQYGDHTVISDVVEMTHEDDVFGETVGLMGEQAAQMLEGVRWDTMLGGTSVWYAHTSQAGRAAVSLELQEKDLAYALRVLKRANCNYITKALSASPNYKTSPIDRAYIAVGHVDLEGDIRALDGFVPREQYTSMTPFDGEVGSWRNIRFMLGSIYAPFEDAATTNAGSAFVYTTTSTKSNVYPLMVFGKGFFSGVSLKGKNAVQVVGKKAEHTESDPFAQRNFISWKTMNANLITNELWGVRIECLAKV